MIKINSSTSELAAIGAKFQLLQKQLEMLELLRGRLQKADGWEEDLDEQWEGHLDAIQDTMFTLAWEATSATVNSAGDCQVRAAILLDYCVPDEGDLVHTLAAALCNDILSRNPISVRRGKPVPEKDSDAVGLQVGQVERDTAVCARSKPLNGSTGPISDGWAGEFTAQVMD